MKRLTERQGKYVLIDGCRSLYPNNKRKGAYLNNAIIRLAEYEDTGLTPEDVVALAKKEKEDE